MIFYCNDRVYITEVYIDTILFLFWKDNHPCVYTTRYSTIDELTTEQPQQNHTQSSHLAAKLIIEYIMLLNIIWIIFFKEIKFKNITVNCLIIK